MSFHFLRRSLSRLPLAAALLCVAAIAHAEPVQYSFTLTNPLTSATDLSFQLSTPSYLMEGTAYRFTPSQLTGVNVNLPGTGLTTLTAIVLAQQNAVDHPVISLTVGLDGPGDVLSRAPIVTISRGPGQPGVYLDRDGAYTLNNVASDGIFGGDTLTFSVASATAATPEPASFLLAAPALAGLWFTRRKKTA